MKANVLRVLLAIFALFSVTTSPLVASSVFYRPSALAHLTSAQVPDSYSVNLPLIETGQAPVQLCRFGVGADTAGMATRSVGDLRISWYADWTATANPPRPGGIAYYPMIRLTQTGPETYSARPSGVTLTALAQKTPGATWIIGNEPDRRFWQDDIEPQVYARAYHDLYHQIKNADPTALIAAGSIVQPSPVRLRYLDLVLQSYQRLYHTAMPVDIWNIHAFILNERSCEHVPEDCWGAEVPPGVDVPEGLVLSIEDNDNVEIFKAFIVAFRQWMADRGYQNRPLIITEFGILMPAAYGFGVDRVNAYMSATFDYLSTAAGPTGYAHDEYRLVQRWAWYSLQDANFNGPLFDSGTGLRTPFGDNFAAYTAKVPAAVNLKPLRVWAQAPLLAAPGASVTLTLAAAVANTGNISIKQPVTVRFFEGDPGQGGTLLGDTQLVGPLDGCGATMIAQFSWASAPPGTHHIWVQVDPDSLVVETNEGDNLVSVTVVAPRARVWLPLVTRGLP